MNLYRWELIVQSIWPDAQQFNLCSLTGEPSVIASVYLSLQGTWRYVIWKSSSQVLKVPKVSKTWADTFDAQSGMSEVNNLLKHIKNIRILSDKESNLL